MAAAAAAAATETKPNGLTYMKEFISREQELELIKRINESEWNTSISRRTQHYGWKYSYGGTSKLEETEPIPEWLKEIKEELDKIVMTKFNQVIINEYVAGQGIAAHTDNPKMFDDIIISVSLGSQTTMIFSHETKPKYELLLEPRSILILSNEARYEYKHEIPKRKYDNGIKRDTRISITFRKVKTAP